MRFLKFKFIVLPVLLFYASILAKGYDESNIHELIKTFLPDDAIVVEAGAHHGTDTRIMSELFSKGTIHSFEPFPSSYNRLRQAVQDLSNVKCYQYALSESSGESLFYVRPDNDGGNCL